MKYFLSSLFFSFLSIWGFVCQAQVSNSQLIFGGNSFDYGMDIAQTADSGYLMLGRSGSYSTSADVVLWKMNKDLDYEWHRIFGLNDVDYAIELVPAGSDTFFVLCSTLYPGAGEYDIWTFIILPNGDTLNSKIYDHSVWEFPTAAAHLSDGGFLIAGTTYDTNDGTSDIFLLKVDQNLNELWFRTIPKEGNDTVATILEYNDRIYLTGTSINPSGGHSDISFIKISKDGTLISESYFGGGNDDKGSDLVVAGNGNLIIGGMTKSFGTNPGFYNTFLLKIDTNAAYIWSQPQTSNDPVDYKMKRILLDANGNIYSFLDRISSNQSDFQVFKNTPSGFFLSSAAYGTYGNEVLGNSIFTNDGGVALFGTTSDFTFGLENFYLVKADSLLLNPLAPGIQVGNFELQEEILEMKTFPNPTNDLVIFQLPKGINNFKLMVINSLGVCVNEINISSPNQQAGDKISLDVSSFAPGPYFVRMIPVDNDRVYLSKFLILDR